jgi:hypothetical protein
VSGLHTSSNRGSDKSTDNQATNFTAFQSTGTEAHLTAHTGAHCEAYFTRNSETQPQANACCDFETQHKADRKKD